MRRAWVASTLLFGPALCWSLAAIVGLGWTLADAEAWTTIDRHGDPVAGSDSCKSCHPEQWRTWHASWHRTMTQPVAPGRLGVAARADGETSILAPFAGEQLDYGGFRATMTRDADGRPRVTVVRLDDDGRPLADARPGRRGRAERRQPPLSAIRGVPRSRRRSRRAVAAPGRVAPGRAALDPHERRVRGARG